MDIIAQLASSHGRNDEQLNIVLAEKIIRAKDRTAVKELVAHLNDKGSTVPNDCMKVLYEIGERQPKLITPFIGDFVMLLEHKNNRLVWGAMTALDALTIENPQKIAQALPAIMKAADGESVIARDHAVGILITLSGLKQYAKKTWPLLLQQLQHAPANQLPMYAEQALPLVNTNNAPTVAKILQARLKTIPKLSKRKRVEKVLMKISKL